MATTTIDTDTELSAVNSILGAIGQAPLTTLNFENPEVSFIFNLLRDANVDTQSEGWHFNTEYHVKFTPDTNKKIAIGADILSWTYMTTKLVDLVTSYVVMDSCMTSLHTQMSLMVT